MRRSFGVQSLPSLPCEDLPRFLQSRLNSTKIACLNGKSTSMSFDLSANVAETVQKITDLQHETVALWHDQPVENTHEGLLGVVCQQHQFNFLLWHEEDIARSPDVGDARIAQVKRAIDGYNQNSNDWIEKIDDFLMHHLVAAGIVADDDAPLNTETPGSAIDRLSIMSLRIYHMQEQIDRTDTTDEHRAKAQAKLDLCLQQHHDLSTSLVQLLEDIFASRKRLKLYRQMKMYNDPTLNPYLYKQEHRKAG